MSKDYRFRKEDLDEFDKSDWNDGSAHHKTKDRYSKSNIVKKKRESKNMSQVRANQYSR